MLEEEKEEEGEVGGGGGGRRREERGKGESSKRIKRRVKSGEEKKEKWDEGLVFIQLKVVAKVIPQAVAEGGEGREGEMARSLGD